MLDDSDYGRCGENGKFRDHDPDEIERYRRGVDFLMTRRAAAVPVELLPPKPSPMAGPDRHVAF